MDLEASLALPDGEARSTIVVEGRLAAEQWEIHLAAPFLGGPANAWAVPPVLTYGAWLERLWTAHRPPGSASLLRVGQSEALWREVIAESAEGPALIGSPGVAAWAADAQRRIAGWDLADEMLAGRRGEADFSAFLRWRRRYLGRLEEAGCIERSGLEAALIASAPRHAGAVELAPTFEPTPVARKLLDVLAACGLRVTTGTHPPAGQRALRVELRDFRHEAAAAARWARRRLDRSPEGRLAVVLPELRDRASEVRRIFVAEGVSEELCIRSGDGAQDARPLIGAAMNALELLSAQGTFLELSRWLRSPFFDAAPAEMARAATLEAELRRELLAQIPFLEAYRSAGLRARFEARLPGHAARLDAALAEIGPETRRAPSHWARIWQRALSRLGWASRTPIEADDLQAWERALEELAALTPILGRVSQSRALAELRAFLARWAPERRLTLFGVHVLADLGDVGPGYDAVWVAGATDRALPRPVALNPLLPRSLQVEHGMPWASPEDALARSRRLLEGLLRRVPELVASWPASEHDHPAQPSPLIRAWPTATLEAIGAAKKGSEPFFEAGLSAEAGCSAAGLDERKRALTPFGRTPFFERESRWDPAPAAPEGRLRGGTRALDAAASCPLRAFCEFRLGAKALEPLTRGVPPRVKGIAVHRALELLYRRHPSRAALANLSEAERRREASACAESALDEIFGSARRHLRALHLLERRRIEAILVEFLEQELERTPFAVTALERSQAVDVGPWRIATRVDRIDELDDGSLAIIDYKTGRAASPADWFAPRPRDSQLPVYAVASTGALSALVIAGVSGLGPSYAGVWRRDDFPGRSARLPEGRSLAEQIEAWRDAIARLLSEYASGDTRLFLADLEAAQGTFAPLTRVYEQLALYKGWIEPWPSR